MTLPGSFTAFLSEIGRSMSVESAIRDSSVLKVTCARKRYVGSHREHHGPFSS
jgi:hypothetical protein